MTFYRRDLPHLQRDNKRHFITFVTKHRWILPSQTRTVVLNCCTHDNGIKVDLDVAVVMPEHVHLIFTPLVDKSRQRVWPLSEIMDAIKGASAHLVNHALKRRGHVWQDESFDHVLRSSEKWTKLCGMCSIILFAADWRPAPRTIRGTGPSRSISTLAGAL